MCSCVVGAGIICEVTSCCAWKPSVCFNFVPSVSPWLLIWSQDSWGDPSHQQSFLPSIRTSATQTRAEWWLLDVEWQSSHMLRCELFSLLNFHIFKGSLKAISVTIVSRSSCIASPKLSVTAGPTFWQIRASPGTKFFRRGARDLRWEEAFCHSTGVPGSPCRFLPKFWLIPRPRDNLPSHLPFIQT